MLIPMAMTMILVARVIMFVFAGVVAVVAGFMLVPHLNVFYLRTAMKFAND